MTIKLSDEASALDLGILLAKAMREAEISYALGGALALGASGLVRATRDVDINVFVEPTKLSGVFAVLQSLGVPIDEPSASAAAESEGMFMAWAGPWRIDVFVPSIAFSWEAEKTRVHHLLDGERVAFLSPESLAVFKLLFFRGKDLLDLEQLRAIRLDLDGAYVRRKIVEMMGEDDPRVSAWDKINAPG